MRISKTLKSFGTVSADILLPDYCANCGIRLCFNRSPELPAVALCEDCFKAANNSIFSINYPAIKRCSLCGYPLTSEFEICGRCRDKNWRFKSSTSLFLYEGTPKQLISAYKFENRKSLSHFFASHIYTLYKSSYSDSSIVPVPFRPSAKRKRGWDQIEIICRILRKEYNLPVSICLQRTNGPAQKTMNYTQRLLNLENKIRIKEKSQIPDKILLIDDVFTTGATMDSCAGVLLDSGCSNIRCLALALDL